MQIVPGGWDEEGMVTFFLVGWGSASPEGYMAPKNAFVCAKERRVTHKIVLTNLSKPYM